MNALLWTSIPITLVAVAYRWRTFVCKFESAPTFAVIFAGLAVYLTSEHASRHLGPALHDLTWMWNFEDLLGHIALMTSLALFVQAFIVRFADDDDVDANNLTTRDMYQVLALCPALAALPALIFCRGLGEAGQQYVDNFDQIVPGPWMFWYWVIVLSVTFWLLLVAGAFALRLRVADDESPRSRVIMNLYLLAIAAMTSFVGVLAIQVYTDFEVRDLAWSALYIGIVLWAAAPAYSWWHRSRPLVIASPDDLKDSEYDAGRSD